MEFCDWLTRKRLELGARIGRRVTQQEVAKKAGISRAYLSFLEAGVNPSTGKPVAVDRDLVFRLAQALGVEPEEAFHAAGFGEQLTEGERDLLRRIRRLDATQENLVRQLLDQFAPLPSCALVAGQRPSVIRV